MRTIHDEKQYMMRNRTSDHVLKQFILGTKEIDSLKEVFIFKRLRLTFYKSQRSSSVASNGPQVKIGR